MIGWFFFSAVFGFFRSSMLVSCSFDGSLSYESPVVVFFDREHPRFRNFYSTVPVDVVRLKSYVNCPFDLTSVPVRITINKLNLIPKRLVSGVLGVLWNGSRFTS